MLPSESAFPARGGIGLALGGGAALGFAHIGILAALRDAGVRISRVSGTSAGAVAAALHAFGVSPDRMRDLLAPITWRTISRYSRSSLGLLTNEPLGEMVRDEVGDVRIEEAMIELAIVAADIHTGDEVVLTTGPLATAVRASTAVPGIYTPVRMGDRLLVDGGVTGNVPIRAVRRMGAETAVAATLGEHLDFQPVRNIFGVLANAFLIAVNTATRATLEDADVIIEPALDGRPHWPLDQPDELIRLGYRAAEEATPAIRAAAARQDRLAGLTG